MRVTLPIILFHKPKSPAMNKWKEGTLRHTENTKEVHWLEELGLSYAEYVYMSLTGQLEDWCKMPCVENAYADGGFCASKYAEVYYAYQRLLTKLNETDYDDDVELIINNFLDIERCLCIRMFELGAQLGTDGTNENR